MKARYLNVGHNQEAAQDLRKTFEGSLFFETPKPIRLLKRLIQISTSSDDLILDFFAGSGTTGDAVMQLNAEDGGKRKFILVQIPEVIDPKNNKAAHDFVKNELKQEPTIFEITKERLIRAAAKIKGKNGEVERELGFRIFQTAPVWEDYDFELDAFDPQAELFDETKLTEEDLKTLLLTWKTADGLPLTQDLVPADLAGYTAYYGSGKLYLMDKGFTAENLKVLLQKVDADAAFSPTVVVAFGYHFESGRLRELAEGLKSYSNRKSADIDFITRY